MFEVCGLHADITGSGPPLLVMHGGMGLDHLYLRPWLDALAGDATLIYYDHRGNGRSVDPADWEAFGPEEWAADADTVRAAVGAERITVFAHSCAVFLALEYARRFPARVAGLILCSGAPTLDYGNRIIELATRKGTPEQLESLGFLFGSPAMTDEEYRHHYMSALPLYFGRYSPHDGEKIRRTVRFHARAFLHGRAKLFAQFDARPWLHTIDSPALVIAGGEDIITPVAEGAQRLAAGLPGSRLEVLDESGHFPFIEEPERFARAVRDWLSHSTTTP